MNENASQHPPSDTALQLERTQAQLVRYARDLKRTVDAERQKTKQLAEANARLRTLDTLKTNVLTFIGHELRTPLSIMSLALDFLASQSSTEEQAQSLAWLSSGYERLHGLTEKGIEYFKWASAEHSDTTQTTNLGQLVDQTARQMPGLSQPGVDFRFSAPSHPCLVCGAQTHIAKVVEIVLNNALKFSETEPVIRAEVGTSELMGSLTVIDQGQGFPPDIARELFEPFSTFDVSHHAQGTGLNLALARAIVTTYGGQIAAKSEGTGHGATFTVAFPLVSLES